MIRTCTACGHRDQPSCLRAGWRWCQYCESYRLERRWTLGYPERETDPQSKRFASLEPDSDSGMI